MVGVTILKAGTTVAPLIPRRGDFEDWFRVGLGLPVSASPVVDATTGVLPDAASTQAVVVTGAAAMVTDDEPWSLACERWLRTLVEREVPVLGVCYGHQLLARAFGGAADFNPLGDEVGTCSVSLTAEGQSDPLFAGLPPQITVQSSHRQSVTALPDGARLLASNSHDSHQAFALGDRAWGVQFHPEFDADIIRGYLDDRSEGLQERGVDVAPLRAAACDSEHGVRILKNFLATL
ncbi:MAG: glutamine amidotransferase [Planctomycetota bacterium]|jgi:GMP synthase (glutamine-hydrolysing)